MIAQAELFPDEAYRASRRQAACQALARDTVRRRLSYAVRDFAKRREIMLKFVAKAKMLKAARA